ncbi:MAG: acetyl-CoA C-acetyltransferase [Pseudochelatococcus sp.]|jgi:acetyl-CoA C-acetyltransferase|uniref:acetyl-CoA C-acetyltransferase n=1 Tax=Pseudochelatococcus sp. TaxID=2020869 RepID=UPI003D8D07AD
MTDIMIYDAVRTPRGKRGGGAAPISPIRLAATPLRALAARNDLSGQPVQDVVLGCVVPVGEQGGDIARAAVLAAGWPQEVPAVQINRFCGSGLDAVCAAAGQIGAGQIDIAVGGGIEHMTRVPMGEDRGAWASDPRETLASHYVPQGIGADVIATQRGYSRADVDGFAAESQARAARAQEAGVFDRSLVPVADVAGRIVLARDEHPRPGTGAGDLAKLRPAFADAGKAGYDARITLRYPALERIEHVHTAGNSSGIVDGAAAVLLGSPRAAGKLGRKPRARLRAWANIGSEPSIMLTGPVPATRLALERAGMAISDIDLFEINEAFASVVLFTMEELGIDHGKVNVNGGAIALGHPLGATGAMLLGTALDELERRDAATALITLCVAGGMGTAAIIERV